MPYFLNIKRTKDGDDQDLIGQWGPYDHLLDCQEHRCRIYAVYPDTFGYLWTGDKATGVPLMNPHDLEAVLLVNERKAVRDADR